MVRVAHRFEVELPFRLRTRRERLRFTGKGVNLPTSGTHLLGDPSLGVAPQLGATRRSPEPSVEDEHDKGVLPERPIEPAAARTWRRIELGVRRVLGVLQSPFGESDVDPFGAARDAKRALLASIAAAQHELKFARPAFRKSILGIENPPSPQTERPRVR